MKKLNKLISLMILLFASLFFLNTKSALAGHEAKEWIYCNLENETVLDDSNKEIHFGLDANQSNTWTFYVKAGTKDIKIYRNADENTVAHAKFLLVGNMQNASPNEYQITDGVPITDDIANSGYNTKENIVINISENAKDGHNIMIYSQEIKSGNFATTNAFINLVIIGDRTPKSLRIINRTDSFEMEEFVYHIKGIDDENSDIDFFVTCKSNSDVTIKDLPKGNYLVEQDENWNFLYRVSKAAQNVELLDDSEVVFENERIFMNWLFSDMKSILNVFEK